MEFLQHYIWLIILISLTAFVLLYKKITNNPDAITSKFLIKKELIGNFAENIKLIENAMKNANFKRIKFDESKNTFYAKTNFSVWSFTEKIEIEVCQEQQSTVLNFKSICSLPTQIIDYGKNKTNYRRFVKGLKTTQKISSPS